MDNQAFIDAILEKLSLLSDASGLNRAMLTVEIAKMLVALKEGLRRQDVQKEQKETNQNGRNREQSE